MIQSGISEAVAGKNVSRQIDSRVVAIGQALLTLQEGIDALRPALLAAGLEADALMGPLREGYCKTSNQIDRALSGLPRS